MLGEAVVGGALMADYVRKSVCDVSDFWEKRKGGRERERRERIDGC